MLEKDNEGFVYSFWPDTLTLKEIGDPRDIATYFRLWDDSCPLLARNIVTQCRQNTNYDIVRYAAHPFFLQGYTLCANGENTFYTKNREFQKSLHRGYTGFESDSQCLLYSLHYVLHELKWPIEYYKHVITPLPFAEIDKREDAEVLRIIRETLAHLEINGPNAIIAMLPDGRMMTCCDSKKLRPVVVGPHQGHARHLLRSVRSQRRHARPRRFHRHLSRREGNHRRRQRPEGAHMQTVKALDNCTDDLRWIIRYDPTRCTMCGSCVAQCMQNAIEVRMMRQDLTVSEKPWPDPEKKHLARPVIRQKTDLAHLCVGCGFCAKVCPNDAIHPERNPDQRIPVIAPRERPHPPRRTHQPEHAAAPSTPSWWAASAR